MCVLERATTSRVARCSAMRTRVLRERRARACLLFINSSSKSKNLLFAGLASQQSRAKPDDSWLQNRRWSFLLRFLELDGLVRIADALALVRLGRPVGADFRGHLSDLLLVHAPDEDFRLHRRLDLDALGHHVDDRMRKAQRQVDLVALRLRAVADTDQRQLLLEADRYALDHVGDERAQRAVHRVVQRAAGVAHQRVAFALDGQRLVVVARQRAQRSLDGDFAGRQRHFDLGGQRNGMMADSRHAMLRYAMMQRTSPPTPVARALRSVITPCDVDTMAMPRPFITRGMSSLLL